MEELLKKLQAIPPKKLKNMPPSTVYKLLKIYFSLTPEEKLRVEQYFSSTNQPIEKGLRLCLNPFSYGLPVCKLKKLSQSDIFLEEIKQIIDEEFGELLPSLYKEVVNHFKAELTDPNYPVVVFISEKHAKQIFRMRYSRLQLYRNTGLLKIAYLEGSFCYSWTQLQELFG